MTDVFAAADGPKRRPNLAFIHRNMRLIAERTRWPDGALRTCMELMARFPTWHVAWMPECTTPGFEQPAGFWAIHDGTYHQVEILEADPERMAQRMAQGPPPHDYGVNGCNWCLSHLGARRVRL
jgi:hypothetical protein